MNIDLSRAAAAADRVSIVFVHFVFAIAQQGKIWRIIYPDVHSILVNIALHRAAAVALRNYILCLYGSW